MSGADQLVVLAVTSLFPTNVDPAYAPFNRLQFGALAKLADVSVLGVVPWRFGRWYARGSSRGVVRQEVVDSMRVVHPRYPSIPGVPSLNAGLMTAALLPHIAREVRRKRPDVLLASYGYPDGCAVVTLGAIFRIPVVVKCHGSDLNRVPDDWPAGFQIRRLLKRAGAVVVVSRSLLQRAGELGIPASRLHVVYNGIDRARFRPSDKTVARQRLSLPDDREIVLYLGHLAEHKGVLDLIDAAQHLLLQRPRATILFVGDGPLSGRIRDRAASSPVAGSMLTYPTVSHAEVPLWMSAADVVCLPSWSEGMPNVVREAHACGRPVVATAVGGIPEAIPSPALGALVPPRNAPRLAQVLADRLDAPAIAPEEIAALARIPTWEESAHALHAVLQDVARASR